MMRNEENNMTKFYCQANARNQEEAAIFEMLEQASNYLVEKLGLQEYLKEVRIERMNGWGKANTRYAGLYSESKRMAKVNIRTLYNVQPRKILEVLCHELRHAVQYMTDMDCIKKTYRDASRHSASWFNHPCEIDAREFQKIYADMVIEALDLDMTIHASEAEPIMVWQGKEQRAVLEAQIGSEIGFIQGTAENLVRYIGLNQLGKKYRRMTKAAFNYAFDNHMDIINEQEVPMMMRELSESERLNGY
jgi:hypothetical protein